MSDKDDLLAEAYEQAQEAANVRAMNAALNATYAAIDNGRVDQARVIAAAPELLEALVRARSYIEAKVSPAERARGPLLGIIDAAIEKARDDTATVVHARRPDARWPRDDIPLCSGPGNTPNDLYSNDARRVSCVACLRLLEDEQ